MIAHEEKPETGEVADAILELPAGRSAEYSMLVAKMHQRFDNLSVQASLEIRDPRLYVVKEQRLYVGAATLRSL